MYDPFESVLDDTMWLIKNNYVQNMSLHEIAPKVGVSRLLTTVINCTEIGYQIGYQSTSSFYNAFKRNTGLSPGQFRGNTENQELDVVGHKFQF
ncbi:helix-turn-helix domain-containing protein [Novibacillus thermophilus]